MVPSIILSAFSAAAGIGQLLLTGTADLLEPAVNGVLALTETSKDTVGLPAHTCCCGLDSMADFFTSIFYKLSSLAALVLVWQDQL